MLDKGADTPSFASGLSTGRRRPAVRRSLRRRPSRSLQSFPVRNRRAQPLPARTKIRACSPRAPAMGKAPVRRPPRRAVRAVRLRRHRRRRCPVSQQLQRAARIARPTPTATTRETACAATTTWTNAAGFGAIERPTSVSAAVKRARRTAWAVTTAIHWSTAASSQSAVSCERIACLHHGREPPRLSQHRDSRRGLAPTFGSAAALQADRVQLTDVRFDGSVNQHRQRRAAAISRARLENR